MAHHIVSMKLASLHGGRVGVALFAIVAAINGFVFPNLARRMGEMAGGGTFRPLDLRVGYSAADALSALTVLGDDGRRFYLLVELTVDVLYPIVYGVFFFLLARWLLAKVPPSPVWAERASLLPFAAAGLDLAENALIVALIARYPERMPTVTALANATTAAKFLCLALTVALVLYAVVRWTVNRRGRRSPAPT